MEPERQWRISELEKDGRPIVDMRTRYLQKLFNFGRELHLHNAQRPA